MRMRVCCATCWCCWAVWNEDGFTTYDMTNCCGRTCCDGGWKEPWVNAAGPGVCGVCGREGLGVLGLRGVNGLAAGFNVNTFFVAVPGLGSPLPALPLAEGPSGVPTPFALPFGAALGVTVLVTAF